MAIAIDFGTSNTCLACWNPVTQLPETLSLSGLSVQLGQNPPLIPSLVYVEDASQAKVVVGQAVRDRGLDLTSDTRFFVASNAGLVLISMVSCPNLMDK
jgi:molecular chaperone DnaK (HSP70)